MGETERFSEELRRLYQAAGAPSYRSLKLQAKADGHHIGVTTLSDWLSGQSVPSDRVIFRWLVENCEGRVARRASTLPAGMLPDYRPRGAVAWEALRLQAVKARQPAATGERERGREQKQERETGPGPVEKEARRKLWPVAAAAMLGTLVGLTAGVLISSHPSTHAQRAAVTTDASAALPAPSFVEAGKTRTADRLPGPYRWYVVHGVSNPDDCLSGWVCLFQNPNFNVDAPGWMILAQDLEKPYNLAGQYDRAVHSWIDNMSVQAGWHEFPDWGGDYHGMEPHTRLGEMGAQAGAMSSLHIFSDAKAFVHGTKP